VLGVIAGGSGEYILSDNASLRSGIVYVGYSGAGKFTQSGGTHSVTGILFLWENGSSGTYNLQEGSLTAGGITVNSGGFFNQTGGTMNAPITLTGDTVAAGTDIGLGSQTLTITSGTLQAASGTTPTLGNDISVNGDFTVGGANNLTLSGAVSLGGAIRTLSVSNTGDTTLSGIISNGGLSINNPGGGALTLSWNNTYTGVTTLKGGTLNLQGANNYTGDTVVSGGILNMTSAVVINYGRVGGANTITGGAVNMSGTLATYLNNSTVTGGTLNLSAGTYRGGLSVGSNGIFNYIGGSFEPSGGGDITSGAGSTTTVAPGLNINLGAGTLTNNGATTINGTLTGNLANNAAGIVGGVGVITGALVNHGTVNPGNSPGTLTVGAYTSNPGATQVVEIAWASNYDRIVTTAGGGATLSPRLLDGYFPSTNTVFQWRPGHRRRRDRDVCRYRQPPGGGPPHPVLAGRLHPHHRGPAGGGQLYPGGPGVVRQPAVSWQRPELPGAICKRRRPADGPEHY